MRLKGRHSHATFKRLEQGTLALPESDDPAAASVKITASQLSLMLEGIELSSIRRRKRYQLAG